MNNETIRFLIEIFVLLIIVIQLHLIRRNVEEEKIIIISDKDMDEFSNYIKDEMEKIEYIEENKDDN